MRKDSRNDLHRIDVRELPQLIELTNGKGRKVLYELMPTKDQLGMFLNRVSTVLLEKLSRSSLRS